MTEGPGQQPPQDPRTQASDGPREVLEGRVIPSRASDPRRPAPPEDSWAPAQEGSTPSGAAWSAESNAAAGQAYGIRPGLPGVPGAPATSLPPAAQPGDYGSAQQGAQPGPGGYGSTPQVPAQPAAYGDRPGAPSGPTGPTPAPGQGGAYGAHPGSQAGPGAPEGSLPQAAPPPAGTQQPPAQPAPGAPAGPTGPTPTVRRQPGASGFGSRQQAPRHRGPSAPQAAAAGGPGPSAGPPGGQPPGQGGAYGGPGTPGAPSAPNAPGAPSAPGGAAGPSSGSQAAPGGPQKPLQGDPGGFGPGGAFGARATASGGPQGPRGGSQGLSSGASRGGSGGIPPQTEAGTPDWGALAAEQESGARKRKIMMLVGGIVAVAVIAGGVATAVVMSGKSSDKAIADPSSSGSTATAQSLPPEPSFSSVAPPPPANPLDYISTAAKDKAPITAGALFPGKQFVMGGRTYVKTNTATTTNCSAAARDVLAGALPANGCGKVIRATYTNGKVAVTVGIAVFADGKHAAKLHGTAHYIAPLNGGGIADFCHAVACQMTSNSVGRYAYFAISGYKNGQTLPKTDKVALQAANDASNFAFQRIIQRGRDAAQADPTRQ